MPPLPESALMLPLRTSSDGFASSFLKVVREVCGRVAHCVRAAFFAETIPRTPRRRLLAYDAALVT